MSEQKNKESLFNKQVIEVAGNVTAEPVLFNRTRGDRGVKVSIACNDVYNGVDSNKPWYVDCIFLEECVDIAVNFQKGDFIITKGLYQPHELKPAHTDRNTGKVIKDQNGRVRRSNASVIVTPHKEEGKIGLNIPVELRYRKQKQPMKQEAPQQYAPQEPTHLKDPEDEYESQQHLFHEEMEKRNTSSKTQNKTQPQNQRFYTRDVTAFNANGRREASSEDVIAGQMSKSQFDQAINEVSV